MFLFQPFDMDFRQFLDNTWVIIHGCLSGPLLAIPKQIVSGHQIVRSLTVIFFRDLNRSVLSHYITTWQLALETPIYCNRFIDLFSSGKIPVGSNYPANTNQPGGSSYLDGFFWPAKRPTTVFLEELARKWTVFLAPRTQDLSQENHQNEEIPIWNAKSQKPHGLNQHFPHELAWNSGRASQVRHKPTSCGRLYYFISHIVHHIRLQA